MKHAFLKSNIIPITELKYAPTGLKGSTGGELQAAPAYGDLAQGARNVRKGACGV